MQVMALAVEHAFDAEAFFDVIARCRLLRRRGTRHSAPEQGIGAIHQTQRGQHRRGLAMGTMDTRLAAALGGIIQAGKIIKHQRRRVKIFHRHRQLLGAVFRQTVGAGHVINQLRADHAPRTLQRLQQRAAQMRFGFRRERQAGAERVQQSGPDGDTMGATENMNARR